MTEKKQKDLIDRVESLEEDIEHKPYKYELWFGYVCILLCMIAICLVDDKLSEKEEKLREIICAIHEETKTPAPKYDFKANKFVTGGYKYDPNLVKKLQELCKSNTH